MYKITVAGKTLVGNNEDSWGKDARLWFEQGESGNYSVVYVGYARKQPIPDGAMNEHGLVFDGFTMPSKTKTLPKDSLKDDFDYSQLTTIMQQCKTVDEVFRFLSQLNLQVLNGNAILNGGMLLFVDKTGKYLVVEPNAMTIGNDSLFALANFSYSETNDLSKISMERYRKGIAYLNNNKIDTTLHFCTSLSDTMSVNRKKVGDGTLYTTIYDLDKGWIHVYFYHDYSQRITFHLKDEVANGNHSINFASLFPNNKQYERLLEYKTPQNSKSLFITLFLVAIVYVYSIFYFGWSLYKKATSNKFLRLSLVCLLSLLAMYLFLLLTNEAIFYFPSPYNDGRAFIRYVSYLPLVLLISIIPITYQSYNALRSKNWTVFAKFLLATIVVTFLFLLGMFAYWQLFSVFG